WSFIQGRTIMKPSEMGPMRVKMNKARNELKLIDKEEKHWFCGGDRSVAMAAELLQQGKVIAIPTDTVYGLACSASNYRAIQRMYEIKRRDENKPLAICLSNVKEIGTWGIVDDIPPRIFTNLLPGPYTMCLRRTAALNSALNPGVETVGIRVPNSNFVRSVAKLVGPLALTSANVSSQPSSFHPDEFKELWPELDGIFYQSRNNRKEIEERRVGSTVVDLSRPGYYRIVRHGIGKDLLVSCLKTIGLNNIEDE
ncbi:YrdC domain-containing protein, mitochondrial, partial [Ooceraea biroi]